MTEHVDRLNQPIKEGSTVAFPVSATVLGIGSVQKLHPKMLTIKAIDCERQLWRGTAKRYPAQIVVLNEIPETLMYLLKNA